MKSNTVDIYVNLLFIKDSGGKRETFDKTQHFRFIKENAVNLQVDIYESKVYLGVF